MQKWTFPSCEICIIINWNNVYDRWLGAGHAIDSQEEVVRFYFPGIFVARIYTDVCQLMHECCCFVEHQCSDWRPERALPIACHFPLLLVGLLLSYNETLCKYKEQHQFFYMGFTVNDLSLNNTLLHPVYFRIIPTCSPFFPSLCMIWSVEHVCVWCMVYDVCMIDIWSMMYIVYVWCLCLYMYKHVCVWSDLLNMSVYDVCMIWCIMCNVHVCLCLYMYVWICMC